MSRHPRRPAQRAASRSGPGAHQTGAVRRGTRPPPESRTAPRASPTSHGSSAARRRDRRWTAKTIGWSAGSAVLVVVLVMVLVGVTGGSSPKTPIGSSSSTALPAALVKQLTSVPAAVLDAVATGGQSMSPQPGANPLNTVTGSSASLPLVGGKPALFFLSTEWCPYCAIERWSLVVALSRFGTFTGLAGASSSPSDLAPDTQTITFASARYTSKYVAFTPVEAQTMTGAMLDRPTSAEEQVLAVWDPKGSVPFFDLAGRYIGGAPSWLSPTMLHGLSRAQIVALLYRPESSIGRLIDANANYITAAICEVDAGRPQAVCTAAGVRAAATELGHSPTAVPFG